MYRLRFVRPGRGRFVSQTTSCCSPLLHLQYTVCALTVPAATARFSSVSSSIPPFTAAAAPSAATPIVAPLSPSSPTSAPITTTPQTSEKLLSPQYGLPVRSNLPEYTYEEVYQHDRPDSYWIVIDGHVYDVTRYAARHPGGGIESTFSRGHGTDVGASFNELHSWKEKRITAGCLIGRIKPGSVSNRVAKPRPVVELDELEDLPLTEVVATIAPISISTEPATNDASLHSTATISRHTSTASRSSDSLPRR